MTSTDNHDSELEDAYRRGHNIADLSLWIATQLRFDDMIDYLSDKWHLLAPIQISENERTRFADPNSPDAAVKALVALDKCPISPRRDIIKAYIQATFRQECNGLQEAMKLLTSWLYPTDKEIEERKRDNSLISVPFCEADKLIKAVAHVASLNGDTILHSILTGNDWKHASDSSITRQSKTDILLKLAYYKSTPTGAPAGMTVIKTTLEAEKQSSFGPLSQGDYYIDFLKMYSSASPIKQPRGRNTVGGGYMLALDGYGLVIDPGHCFLNNFYAMGHTIDEINGIAVTHFHDDHYADLPSLLSLLHKKHKNNREPRKTIQIFLDRITEHRLHNLIDPNNAPHLYPYTMQGNQDTPWIQLGTRECRIKALPTRHKLYKEDNDEDTGVGFAIDIPARNTLIVITGDTRWNSSLEEAYKILKTGECASRSVCLVAHISTCHVNEVPYSSSTEAFHKNHLCLHGLGKAIEALDPTVVLLSEVGLELKGARETIADIILQVYPDIKLCKWAQLDQYPKHPIMELN